MTSRPKKEYISVLKERYKKANKKEKTYLLTLLSDQANVHRKYANRVLNGQNELPKGKRGRKPIYSPECLYHLKKLFKAMNYCCSIKMKAAMPYWLKFYQDDHLNEEIRQQLLDMSSATIERILKSHKAKLRRYLNTGTKYKTYLKNKIPIRPFDYNVDGPGHFEGDTVAHCGNSLLGSFVWSLTFTDIYSGWTENRAVWNKGAEGVKNAIADIEKDLPFQIKSFHCDNGTEFLSQHLDRYFNDFRRKQKIQWTRSRPMRKNDSCHVEQKNWTHVRETFGYERYGQAEYVAEMNSIYKEEQYLLYNFFIPSMKLKSKLRVGSKYKRKYSEPKTPYQRLLESDKVTDDQKQRLRELYEVCNPFELRIALQKKINQLHTKITDEKKSVKPEKLAS